ncbi:MAG: endolytic transglycosylase MltG [Peptostreptococcaceae bacterium]
MNIKENKLKVIGIVSVIVVVLIGTLVSFGIGPYNKNNKKDIVVDIPSGSSVSSISNILYENKLIRNKALFKVVVKISGDAQDIKAGKYLVNQTYSNKDILNLLVSGKIYNDGIKITIPEGSTSMEIIDTLTKKKIGNKDKYKELINNPSKFYDNYEFLDSEDIVSLEGFLYPDTYYFKENDSEEKVISTMLSRFKKEYTESLDNRRKEMNMTLQEVINLSSIIEKEAVLDKDRPIIASVFYNRLDIDMKLQSDATIQYIFEERKKIVTYKDLEIDSPYNTYLYKGLPPTPIANPGIKSIKAALYPEATKYIYFVAKMDGGNNYSENYEDHLKYVKEYKDERDKLNKEKEESEN